MKFAEMESVFYGFGRERAQGRRRESHFKLINANGSKPIVLAQHYPKEYIAKGTLSAIRRQADLVRWKNRSIHERSRVEKKKKYSRGRLALRRCTKRW